MNYTVECRKEPKTRNLKTILGKDVVDVSSHDGKKAAFVKLESGVMEWGFGNSWEDAEHNAFVNAKKLSQVI